MGHGKYLQIKFVFVWIGVVFKHSGDAFVGCESSGTGKEFFQRGGLRLGRQHLVKENQIFQQWMLIV